MSKLRVVSVIVSMLLSAGLVMAENQKPVEAVSSTVEEQLLTSILTEELKTGENTDLFSELDETEISEDIDLLSDNDIEILNEILLGL